ncbi:MAG: arginine N-succinyltransferase [Thermoproteota archaeon]|jgi:arginine N-succinyltransferase
MFLLRSVEMRDKKALLELSSIVFFINLPNDEGIINQQIQNSIKSFHNPSKELSENIYIFVLEEVNSGNIVGVSMIHAQHGTEAEPHFYLTVSQEYKYSNSINTGFIHGTLKLGLNTNGPTEIGALVLSPEFRGHKDKLGKQLSFVRFLYMALNQTQFKDTVLSELMPPLDESGNSHLWEAIGRRFMNMDYAEADLLSRSNKEFILSLYPAENIYQTLIPIEARNSIGKVGKDTLPVKKMLEGIGFQYTNEVDPFDGGPHYTCKLKSIRPIKSLEKVIIADGENYKSQSAANYIIKLNDDRYSFCSLMVEGTLKNNELSINMTKLSKNTKFDLPQRGDEVQIISI